MGIDKVCPSAIEAVADIVDGSVVMMDGFGGPGGMPQELIMALREHGPKSLTIISNTAGLASFGSPGEKIPINHSILVENGQVKKFLASFPANPSSNQPSAFELLYREGKIELELVPQGTLAERIRAGGAGVTAFYIPTGVGTELALGKEVRIIDGKEHLLEYALTADFACIRASKADTIGNLVYKGTSRNFNAVMATAARVTIAEVDEIVAPGELDPEAIGTPGMFVNRIITRVNPGIHYRS